MADFHQIAGFDVLATLGEGAHSTIYSVRDKKGQPMVLKRVIKEGPSQQRFIDQALQEHEVASKVDHPRVRKSIKVIKQRNVIRVSEVLVLMEMVKAFLYMPLLQSCTVRHGSGFLFLVLRCQMPTLLFYLLVYPFL